VAALSSSAPALRSHPIVQTFLNFSQWRRWHDLFSALFGCSDPALFDKVFCFVLVLVRYRSLEY